MSRENEKPNSLRTCPECGNVLVVVKARDVGMTCVRRTKRCSLGHVVTTEERRIGGTSSDMLTTAAPAAKIQT